MVFKLTNLIIADTTNGVWLRTFHLYKGFFRKFTITGQVVRGSIKKIKVPSLNYKSIKYKSLRVGYSRRALIIVANKIYKLKNDLNYSVSCNAVVIYGKRKSFKGNSITGIMTKQVQQRKYIAKAIHII